MELSIKAARINAGLRQADVACKVGVSRNTISKWERGITVPDVDKFLMLSKIYNVPCDCLRL